MFTKSELEQWDVEGYVLVKSLFDQEEIGLLFDTAKNDPRIRDGAIALEDAEGGTSRLTGWNHPGDDLYGMFARCERLVNLFTSFGPATAEKLSQPPSVVNATLKCPRDSAA